MVTIVIVNSYCTFNAPKNIYFYPNKFFCCCKVGLKTSLLYPLLCFCVSQANDGSTNIADITVQYYIIPHTDDWSSKGANT